jgi:hypothetical protein
MPTIRCLVVLILACVLLACGGKKPGGAASGSAATGSTASAPKGNATAEEVAAESRGDVDCPAKIKSPARDANAAVDDVVGVRPGLSYDEAANIVLCTNDLMVLQPSSGRGVNIQTYGTTLRQGFGARFAEPRIQKTSKQIMQEMQDDAIGRSGNRVQRDMKPGQSKWYVATMGMPGEDRVISAAREEWFAEGKNPTRDSVEQALLGKYGTPTRNIKSPGQTTVIWAHDPFGRLVTETSPLYNRCTGNASPDGGANYTPDCGTVVMAIVVPMPDNQALAQYIQVGVVNQAGGYEAITATEQALAKQDAQKKARQVEEASKNADKPQL